jgi:hypothetical protein
MSRPTPVADNADAFVEWTPHLVNPLNSTVLARMMSSRDQGAIRLVVWLGRALLGLGCSAVLGWMALAIYFVRIREGLPRMSLDRGSVGATR